DQSLVLARPELVRYNLTREPRQQPTTSPGHEQRDPRRPRRLPPGLRRAPQPAVAAPLDGPQRGGDDRGRRGRRLRGPPPPRVGGGSPGLGDRFRRWLFAPGVAETRQRRSQQRLLERTR